MPFTLLPLTPPQLQGLANSQAPADLAAVAEDGAFPPPFVAVRAMKLAADGPAGAGPTWFLIRRAADGRLVGACGFKALLHAGPVEVGYSVAPSARGAGAATAALRLLCAMAWQAGVTAVRAQVAPGNLASVQVVHKAGFEHMGMAHDATGELLMQWQRQAPG